MCQKVKSSTIYNGRYDYSSKDFARIHVHIFISYLKVKKRKIKSHV